MELYESTLGLTKMIYIKFFRFQHTPNIIKSKQDQSYHNVFNTVFDHETIHKESDCPITRAHQIVRKWLEDHYGKCIIYQDNQTEFDKPVKITVCNCKKMKKIFKDRFETEVYITKYTESK